MAQAYPATILHPGQVWEDSSGNIRQIFSVWRGTVTYGFVKAMGGEFGSDACDVEVFESRYARNFRQDIISVEDYLLHLSNLAIKEVRDKHTQLGLKPPTAKVVADYPHYL